MMEAVRTSETSVSIYRTIWRINPENIHLPMQYFSIGCQEHFPYIKGIPVLTIDSQWEFCFIQQSNNSVRLKKQ
jgi:hypothetical protein